MISDAIRSHLPNQFVFAFACMEAAEKAIKAAHLNKKQSNRAFKLMAPTRSLIDKSIDLYEAHAREICQRIKRDEDTRPATDAELLAVFSDTSLKAPLTQIGGAAMEQLFEKCFPRGLNLNAGAHREPWPGAIDAEISAARKKFRVETRR